MENFYADGEICHKCGLKEVKWICRACGAGLCRNCVSVKVEKFPICLACGSKNIKELKTEKRKSKDLSNYFCGDCKSRKIVLVTKYVKTCSKCGSTQVVDFAEEQATLKAKFRKLSFEIKYGYIKLGKLARKFDYVKRTLIFVRRSRFFNYPVIERTLMDVFNDYNLVKMRVLGKIEEIGSLLVSIGPKFSIEKQFRVEDLPYLRSILTRIETDLNNYKSYVDESLTEITEKLSKLEILVSSLYKHCQEFSEYKDILSLDFDEKPVYVIQNAKFSGSDIIRVPKEGGKLFLTDRRIIFLAEKGLFKKSFYKSFEIPLDLVRNVEIRGRLMKRLIIKCNDGELAFSFSSDMLPLVKDYINIALNFEKYSLKDTIITSKVSSLILETSDLKAKVEKILNRIKRVTQTEHEDRVRVSKDVVTHGFSYSLHGSEDRVKMEIFKLEREKYETEETIRELKQYFEDGLVSVENYFKYYRSWIGKLYAIERRLRELKGGIQSSEFKANMQKSKDFVEF